MPSDGLGSLRTAASTKAQASLGGQTDLNDLQHGRACLLIRRSKDKRAAKHPDACVHWQTVTSSAIGQLVVPTGRFHELVNGGSGGLAA